MVERMRVLWFTGVQLPALSGQGLTRGGWQEGLRAALESYQPQIELGIVNFASAGRDSLVQGNATYFTIPRQSSRGRLARTFNAWRHTTYSPDDLARAIEIVARFQPDLVHFHGTENFYGLIADQISPPSVLSLQAILNGLHPFIFTDARPRDFLRQLGSLKFVKGGGLIHRWLTLKKYLRVEQKILHTCRNYIGRTGWDQAVLAACNPQARYFHCDEVLADGYYTTEWRAEAASRAVIYSTTTDAFFKGSLTLARALAILKRRGWKDIQLRLTGVEARSYVGAAVTRLAREEGLQENIVWLGRLSPTQIGDEMLRAGVYVHASHMDNSPNSLCEAMLVGMPCVAAFAGGVPSLVTDGVDGLLYHDRDAYILADKIAGVLNDPALATRLGGQARRRALARHDRQGIAARTDEIYRQVAQDRFLR
jgi:glycosyltransferase involved in cell wall biosynthesis